MRMTYRDAPRTEDAPWSLIGARLREVRRRERISQEWVARRLGVRREHVTRIEQGKQRPSLGLLIRWARVLGVSLDMLVAPARDWQPLPDLRPPRRRPTGFAARKNVAHPGDMRVPTRVGISVGAPVALAPQEPKRYRGGCEAHPDARIAHDAARCWCGGTLKPLR